MQKIFTKLSLIILFFSIFISTSYAQWSVVGTAKFTNTFPGSPTIKVMNGTPYVAYSDNGNGNKATVMKFDGTNWVPVGTMGFSAGSTFRPTLEVDNGTLYVGYSDNTNGNKVTVMKFDGTNWVSVGSPGFSTTSVFTTTLKLKNGIPYVAFNEGNSGAKATVMKFDGTNWVLIGNAGFTAGTVNGISIDVDNGTPYVAFEDGSIGNSRATVMKFDGTNWVLVGNANFTGSFVGDFTIDIDNGTPYVGFVDGSNSSKATVRKFDGTNWVAVGTPGFSAGNVSGLSFEMNNGTPYVGYGDVANGGKATVMKFDGTNWVPVGTSGFSTANVSNISLALSLNSNLTKPSSVDGGSAIKIYVVFQDGYSEDPLTVMVHISSASIQGRKFEDKNSNGIQDVGELGLVNWQIICDQDTVKTDSLGNYLFSGLSPGLHKVSEVEQSGWTRTLPADTNNYDITLAENEQRDSVNFGNKRNLPVGNLSGRKYWDKNGNGIIDLNRTPVDSNDVPLQGFKIKLSTGDSTVTDANGFFVFKDLPVGEYGVLEIQKSGWEQTIPTNINGYQVPVMENKTDTTSIFANKKLTGTIKGRKYWDKNGNGVIDSNDVPLFNFKIKLSTGDFRYSDLNGYFIFKDLPVGEYGVSEEQKKGWVQTLPANNGIYQVPIGPGDVDTTSIFANKPLPAIIMGVKFSDLNVSFSRNTSDSLMAGWTISAIYDGKTVTAVTDSNGKYTFTINFDKNIPINVEVKETLKPGWVQTFPNDLPLLPPKAINWSFEIFPGDTLFNKDFGNYFVGGTIEGVKFQDNNGNGFRDEQVPPLKGLEPGLDGWVINLSNGMKDTTYGAGFYSFSKLLPGTYTVSEESQPNWTQTNPSGNGVYIREITDKEKFENIFFGNKPDPGSISGFVFKDNNENGIKDEGDSLLVGWKVFLASKNSIGGFNFDVEVFTLTDSTGFYQFTNLFPANYLVSSELKPGWTSSVNQNITITAGENKLNINFIRSLFFRKISGTVRRPSHFYGLNNWVILLDGSSPQVTETKIGFFGASDKRGFFEYIVEPGHSYDVSITGKAGWVIKEPSTVSVYVGIDNQLPHIEFLVKPIAGSLFGDIKSLLGLGKVSNQTQSLLKLNGSGLPPTPIPVTLEIMAQENNVVYDTLTFIDTTDALGNYSFDLPFGNYTVKPILPPGWKYDAVSDTMFTGSIDTLGTIVNNVSFTVNPPATITGQKFLDLNRNGVHDPTEVGLDSVTIQLFDNASNLLQQQTTHSIEINGDSTINPVTESGLFVFQPLTAGNYVVKEQVPMGWMQTLPAAQDSYQVALSDGQIVDSVIFGNKLPDSLDFGDLPSPYKTLLLGNGPKHKLGGYTLGAVIDNEPDGQPQAAAIGDDQTGSVNDEDGIVFTDQLVAGSVVTMQVTVNTPSGKSGFLNGWIDYNQDGILDTTAEHIFNDTTLSTGTHTLSYAVSATALKGGTFARFRFSDTPGLLPIDSPPFANQDITIGEVEDYILGIDTIITAIRIDNNGTVPKKFVLFQNYPNPFNPSTTIQYSVKTGTDVRLEIFNVLGQRVMTLVDKFQNAGTYKAVIDFNKLTSGVYFYRIQMDNFVQSKKMILLK